MDRILSHLYDCLSLCYGKIPIHRSDYNRRPPRRHCNKPRQKRAWGVNMPPSQTKNEREHSLRMI